MIEAVAALLKLTCDELGPDKDITAVIKPIEKRAGVEVRAEDKHHRPPSARRYEISPVILAASETEGKIVCRDLFRLPLLPDQLQLPQ